MNRTFYALLLAPALASAACAVGEVGPQPVDELATAESPAIVNNPLIGTYTAKGVGAGRLALLVIKNDGTYHSAQVVYCLIGPCPPVATDGRYRLELRSDASFLTLMTDESEIVAKYQYALVGETLRLRNVYTPTTTGAWQSMERAVKAWCATDTDCATQNLPTGPCAGEWMCGAESTCSYQCAPVACASASQNGS